MLQRQRVGDVVQVSMANVFQTQGFFHTSRTRREHKKVIVGVVAGVHLARREHRLQIDHEAPARVAGERHFQIEISAGDRTARDLRVILGLVFQPDIVQTGCLIELLQQRNHSLNVRGIGREIIFRNGRLECRRLAQLQRERDVLWDIASCFGGLMFALKLADRAKRRGSFRRFSSGLQNLRANGLPHGHGIIESSIVAAAIESGGQGEDGFTDLKLCLRTLRTRRDSDAEHKPERQEEK